MEYERGKLIDVADGLSPALYQFAVLRALRGRDMADAMRWIMKEWVKSAIESIPGTSRARILQDLSARVTTTRRAISAIQSINPFQTTLAAAKAAGRIDRWRGTLAAAIVAVYNIGGARHKAAGAFYQAVNKWAMRKAFGANLHKAGLQQARRALHISAGGEPAKLRRAPGDYRETITEEAAEMLAENWASSAGKSAAGITGLAPNAFLGTISAVEEKFKLRMQREMVLAARQSGFAAQPA